MNLCDQYLKEMVEINPTMNDLYEFPGYEHLKGIMINPYTDDYKKKELEILKKYKKILSKKKIKNYSEEYFYREVRDLIGWYSLDSEYLVLDALNNFPLDIVSELSGEGPYRFTDKKSYEIYMMRLQTVPSITDSVIDKLKKGIKKKYVLPKIVVKNLIKQYKDYLKKPLNKKELKDYKCSIESFINNSVKRLLSFLEGEYLKSAKNQIGIYSEPYGKQSYTDTLRSFTLEDITCKQVHDLGLKEVQRIYEELQRHFKEYNVSSLSGLYNAVGEDSKDPHKDIVEIQKRINDKIMPKYFGKSLVKDEMPELKKISSENKLHFAYYISKNFKRNSKTRGAYYINLNNDLKKNELLSLTLHESFPGHHYERRTNINERETPIYMKAGDFTGYVEGWALYCESLIDIHTKEEYIFRLKYEMHRAVRLVIDTAIHYFEWSYERCFKYMKKYLLFDDNYTHNELIRYICDPGQALAYKIGELTILKLRKIYFEKYNNDYIGFHKKVMEYGPCSLDELIERFLEI